MLKVFDIETVCTSYQVHSVVADNMARAEVLFSERYPGTTIKCIKLHSEYVLVQEARE